MSENFDSEASSTDENAPGNPNLNTSARTPNLPLIGKVLGHLLTYPESHDQGRWFRQNCTTTGCVAGWSASLAGRTMIRSSPWMEEVERVVVLPTDPIDDRGDAMALEHWTPKPEFLKEVAAYEKANQAYGKLLQANPDAAGLPPVRPEKSTENYTLHHVQGISISHAGAIDLGISYSFANFLFAGHQKIGAITIALGALLAGRSETDARRMADGDIDIDEKMAWAKIQLNDTLHYLGNVERRIKRLAENLNIPLSG